MGEAEAGGGGEQVEFGEVDVAHGDRQEPHAGLVEAEFLEADGLGDGVVADRGQAQVGVGQVADGELLAADEETGGRAGWSPR
ncbi:hypothetical protein GCM10020000_85890 [Streptomyces olivoverticillatus]